MCTIHSLPDVILLDIFSRLTFKEVCLCSSVCRRWHDVCQDYTLKRRITVAHPLKRSQLIRLVEHHFTELLQEFRLLQECPKPLGRPQLPALKKECLFQMTRLTGSRFKKLVLMSLSLMSVSVEDFPAGLRHLSLRGCETYPDRFFGQSPQLHLPQLECLDIGGISNFLTSHDLHVLEKMKTLRALYLEGCFRINSWGIISLGNLLSQLVVLDVEGTDVSNEGAVVIFQSCTSIQDLYMGNTVMTNEAFSDLSDESGAQNLLPHLRTFCVRMSNVSCFGLHLFLVEQFKTRALDVFCSFDCLGCYGCTLGARIIAARVSNSRPSIASYCRCDHYKSHKTYGLNT